jgi:hypothetical protein
MQRGGIAMNSFGRRPLLLLMCAAIVAAGCNAHRLRHEHQALRGQVIALYENQILDNLVRSRRCDVLVHLNYSDFTGESRTFVEAAGQVGDDDNDNLANVGDLSGQIIELDQDAWFANLKGHAYNQLTMKANPVSGPQAALVYEAYREFANDDAKFRCGDEVPTDAFKTRSTRRWNWSKEKSEESFCWVTDSARQDFYELVIATTLVQPSSKEGVEARLEAEASTDFPGVGTVKTKTSATLEKLTPAPPAARECRG